MNTSPKLMAYALRHGCSPREALERAMRNTSGNVTQAALYLGVSRATMHRWLREEVPPISY
jgi:transcriptional regulator of acetoin/glycerol metabolism